MHHLVSRFAHADLDLRLADAPFAGGVNAANLFQLDIRRARAHDVRSEHFLAWTGAKESLAAVQGVDPRQHQLVLVVRENAMEFEEAVPRWMVKLASSAPGSMEWKRSIAARAGVSADSVVARSGGASIVRSTRGSTRHMLVGRDERQLFMCELPAPCTTVRQAHEALRAPAARASSRSRSALERPIRQGEWFFVVPSTPEIDELEALIRGNRVVVRRKASINAFIWRSGKPHIADEIAAVVNRAGPWQRVYVRGGVRHPDHKTVELRQWRQVVRNLEVDQARSPLGGSWMD
jgi:hypothetical protein